MNTSRLHIWCRSPALKLCCHAHVKAARLFLSLHCPAWVGFVELYAVAVSCLMSALKFAVSGLRLAAAHRNEWLSVKRDGRQVLPPAAWSLAHSLLYTKSIAAWTAGPAGIEPRGPDAHWLFHEAVWSLKHREERVGLWVTHLPVCPGAVTANFLVNSHVSFWSVFTFNFQIRVLLMLHQ